MLTTLNHLLLFHMFGNGFQDDLAYTDLLNGGLVQKVSIHF